MYADAQTELRYYDAVTIRHKDTKVFLHSHPEKYPLKYDDGRISSQGMSYIRFHFIIYV
jgi:dolichyl-phosphate-mannose--protein O-mannosyl transferase